MFHPPKPEDAEDVTDWFFAIENGKKIIKRMVSYVGKRSSQRYPINLYKNLNGEELEKFLARLNGRNLKLEKARNEALFRHAFISPELWGDFEDLMRAEIPNSKDVNYLLGCTQKHFLNYFIVQLELRDPVEWKEKESKWGQYLLATGKSSKTIRHWVQMANRFIRFLSDRYPREITRVEFDPISKARLKMYDSERKLKSGFEPKGQFIPLEDWKKIEKKLPEDIKPFIQLAYYYGLRRGEALGLKLTDIKEDSLTIERKLVSSRDEQYTYEPVKDRDSRETPHWFATPQMTYDIVDSIKKRMHPDVLGVKFIEYVETLGMSYQMHDLRRTFITTALRKQLPVDVMRAVGHADLATTQVYIMDDRQLSRKVFVPNKKPA